jgi:hypothetical protein
MHRHPSWADHKTREPQPLAITISREAGAGGIIIAELLAKRLTAVEKTAATSPWVVFDANLAKQVLEDHKLPPELERFITEDVRLPIESLNQAGIVSISAAGKCSWSKKVKTSTLSMSRA